MKLHEVLDAGVMAHKLDVLNKDKPKSTRTLIRLLKAKSKKRNPRSVDTDQESVNNNADAFAGYTDSFSSFVDQGVWK